MSDIDMRPWRERLPLELERKAKRSVHGDGGDQRILEPVNRDFNQC